jgi:UPF0176 protein
MSNLHTEKPFRILLYYKYVQVEDHEQFAKDHLKLCNQLGLKGRILIAHEGINGTVSGTVDQTDTYMKIMHEDPRFADMIFKIDDSEQHGFQKMHVRPREELVTFKLEEDINPNELTGNYLSPQEFYDALQRDDVIVIDGRNDYEYDIGHFRGAIRPKVQAFRDFPEWIRENLSEHKDKKVLTYCTGGIRCEKLSGFLIKEGFSDVSQLHGGIVTYGKDPEVKGRLFDGKLYVFDERIAVPVNQTEEATVVGKCYHCKKPEDIYINCAYDPCDLRHMVCENCLEEFNRYCSAECAQKDHEQSMLKA